MMDNPNSCLFTLNDSPDESPDKPESEVANPKLEKKVVRFQTWKEIGDYCKEKQSCPVVEKQGDDYRLVRSFKRIADAREFIVGTHYLIWYTPQHL